MLRRLASCRPQAPRSWWAAAARTRLMAMSRWRQSTSAAPTPAATSRARSRRSRATPSGSRGAWVMASRIRSSSMPRSRSRISARLGTVKKARSWWALVSFWFTLRAMSSASVRTWRSSIDSMTLDIRLDDAISSARGQFSNACPEPVEGLAPGISMSKRTLALAAVLAGLALAGCATAGRRTSPRGRAAGR